MSETRAVHIAVYQWKGDAPVEEIESAIESLKSIADELDQIDFIKWGRNGSKYSEGYTHAILVVGRDEAAINAYRQHPQHEPVALLLDKWEERGVGVDFND